MSKETSCYMGVALVRGNRWANVGGWKIKGVLPSLVLLWGSAGCAGADDTFGGDFEAHQSAETPEFETIEQAAIQNGPEGAGVELTLAPLRSFGSPGPVYIERVRETIGSSGMFHQKVYFYQPNASTIPMQIHLRALRSNQTTETAHSYSNVKLLKNPGATTQTTQTLPNGSGHQIHSLNGDQGWYAVEFDYHASFANRTLQVEIYNNGSTRLPIQWVDPPAATLMDVRLDIRSSGQNPVFLKGGAYRNASESETAHVSQVKLNSQLMYDRSFDQGLFNFPLGGVTSGTYTVDFRLQASGAAKYWFGVNRQSFDSTGVKRAWDPVQFLYQGPMHTGDYDAWNEGVAYAQGAALVAGTVRPPPVRRGTDFVVSIEHGNLSTSDASLQVTPANGGTSVGWTATKLSDYQGGHWNGALGRQAKQRELWRIQVPEDANAGRYVLSATVGGSTIGSVLFYVLFDPYEHVANYQLTEAELATYGYDEDVDGVNLTGAYGTDHDHYRDNFTANYQADPYQPYGQRTKLTGAFRRTSTGNEYSLLDFAAVLIDGTGSEFEAMKRLYRFVAQRINWNRQDHRDDSSLLLINTVSLTDVASTVLQGNGFPSRVSGQCYDYGTALAALGRSAGMVTRAVTGLHTAGFGDHVFTEAFIADVPHHGGGTVPYWTKNKSDVDPWYVFDPTDSLGFIYPPANPWQYSTEAIAPRSQYKLADRIVTGDVPAFRTYTAGLNWNPLTDEAPPGTVTELTSKYLETADGKEFWLNSAFTSIVGVLSTGEKDVYKVGEQWTGATAVQLTTLGGSPNIVPKMCVVPVTSSPGPLLSARCSNPSTLVTLPTEDVYIVVFNDALLYENHHGDYLDYKLQLLY